MRYIRLFFLFLIFDNLSKYSNNFILQFTFPKKKNENKKKNKKTLLPLTFNLKRRLDFK